MKLEFTKQIVKFKTNIRNKLLQRNMNSVEAIKQQQEYQKQIKQIKFMQLVSELAEFEKNQDLTSDEVLAFYFKRAHELFDTKTYNLMLNIARAFKIETEVYDYDAKKV